MPCQHKCLNLFGEVYVEAGHWELPAVGTGNGSVNYMPFLSFPVSSLPTSGWLGIQPGISIIKFWVSLVDLEDTGKKERV